MKKTPNPQSPFSPAPDEPPNAFEAFRVYFNLPGSRHLTDVAEKIGVSVRTVSRWANSFDWSGRINRHRANLLKKSAQLQADQQRDEAISWSDRSAELREREWEIGRALLQAIQRRLCSDVLNEATLADLARSFAAASRISRLATRLPNTPQDDAPAEDPRIKELDRALEIIVSDFKAKQAAAGAGQQPPSPPFL